MYTREEKRVKLAIDKIIKRGQIVKLLSVTGKDKFGHTLTSTKLECKAFPIYLSSFPRSIIMRTSWIDEVDGITFISHKSIEDEGLDFEDLKKYTQLELKNKRYNLIKIEEYGIIGESYHSYKLGFKGI